MGPTSKSKKRRIQYHGQLPDQARLAAGKPRSKNLHISSVTPMPAVVTIKQKTCAL